MTRPQALAKLAGLLILCASAGVALWALAALIRYASEAL